MKFILAFLVVLLAPVAALAQGATINPQIHNAPGWVTGTFTYHAGPPNNHKTRVNNGAAWNGSSYTSGLRLDAYELLDPGSGEGATCTSVTGPTGTGSNITDGGTCHWKWLSVTDYVTISGWTLDVGLGKWQSGTTYTLSEYVHTDAANSPVYQMMTPGCVSTVKPTGTTVTIAVDGISFFDGLNTGDGCYWIQRGNIGYTSETYQNLSNLYQNDSFTGYIDNGSGGAGSILTVVTPPTKYAIDPTIGVNLIWNIAGSSATGVSSQIDANHWNLNISQGPICSSGSPCTFYLSITSMGENRNVDYYHTQVWNDAEYVSGANGELAPIYLRYHNYRWDDAQQINSTPTYAATASQQYGLPQWLEAAPGESFIDTLAANPSLPLAGYNANLGVALRGTGSNYGLSIIDNTYIVKGLQIRSETGSAITSPSRAANYMMFEHNIIESGTGAGSWVMEACGYDCFWWDNLIVSDGGMGSVRFDYGGRLYYNTIVCPSGGCWAASSNTRDWANLSGLTIQGNAVFGFQHFTSSDFYDGTPTSYLGMDSTYQGIGNATDLPSTDGADFPATSITVTGHTWWALPFQTGAALCLSSWVASDCGIMNNVSPSAVFVAWPGNYRMKVGSPLIGAGMAFGGWNWCGETVDWKGSNQGHETPLKYNGPYGLAISGPGSNPVCIQSADTPDLLGQVRPTSGHYDIGAVQFLGAGGSSPGGRFLFR